MKTSATEPFVGEEAVRSEALDPLTLPPTTRDRAILPPRYPFARR